MFEICQVCIKSELKFRIVSILNHDPSKNGFNLYIIKDLKRF